MRELRPFLVLAATVAIVLTTPFALSAATYSVDPESSRIGFSITNLGVDTVRGRFNDFDGRVTYTGTIESLVVEGTVQVESIDTGIRMRDRHLRSEDYFAVERFPTIVYRSTGIRRRGGTTVMIGTIRIRDRTRPIELEVELDVREGSGALPDQIGVSAIGTLQRSEFGVTPPGAGNRLIGETVTLDIEIVTGSRSR